MEISPIIGVRVLPAVKPAPRQEGPTALFDLEAIARTGDDYYSGGSKKAAGAEENDEDELDMNLENEDDSSVDSEERKVSTGISFFA